MSAAVRVAVRVAVTVAVTVAATVAAGVAPGFTIITVITSYNLAVALLCCAVCILGALTE